MKIRSYPNEMPKDNASSNLNRNSQQLNVKIFSVDIFVIMGVLRLFKGVFYWNYINFTPAENSIDQP